MKSVLQHFCGRRIASDGVRRTLRHKRFTSSDASLPIVDISPFLDPNVPKGSDARAQAALKLDAACRDVGFFYLVGHGVPEADMRRLHALARDFFFLPQATKDNIALTTQPESGRGYQRIGENITEGSRDWHEAIDLYAEPAADSEHGVDFATFSQSPANVSQNLLDSMRPFVFGKNLWPQEPSELRSAAQAHIERGSRIGHALMEAMALAFKLPEGHFKPLIDRSFWCMRIIGYPASDAEAETHQSVGVGEHTDYGCWTILLQDDTPNALEVRRLDGSWASVPPIPGSFVVNLGDMLSVWTQGRYVATPHRVCRPRWNYRTSVAFFFEPNYDAIISPKTLRHDSSTGDGSWPRSHSHNNVKLSTEPLRRAAQGEDLVYGEHLFAKVAGNFDFTTPS